MSSTQKIIKYLAIALAFFLSFSIISSIIIGIISLSNIFNQNTNDLNEIKIKNNIENLDIEVTSVNIFITEGTSLKIETNNNNINYKEINNKLFLTEKNSNWFNKPAESDLIIYIPEDYTFDNVYIENAIGKLEITRIKTKEIELNLGAGQTKLNNLNIINEASIEGGAGKIIIKDGNINNLDLDMGIGKIFLTAILTGNNEINAGIVEITLNLLGSKDDYKVKVDKGIGEAVIDGNYQKNSANYGNGVNIIEIEGGIGNINIRFN